MKGTDDRPTVRRVATRQRRSNDLLNERCANDPRSTRAAVRCIVAGHKAGSRDGDSNPRPAHYEQFQAQRCAHRRNRSWHADRWGAAGAELSAELARRAVSMLSTGINSPPRRSHQQALEPPYREVSFAWCPEALWRNAMTVPLRNHATPDC
jgi:hypothetical protein